jgi:16S rRNA C967 or C1407 C5-methylase (RsmB/RsmF family)
VHAGKTTHIAALMGNKGRVLALDRTETKAARIRRLANTMGLDCIRAEGWDSTACLREDGAEGPVSREGMLWSCGILALGGVHLG